MTTIEKTSRKRTPLLALAIFLLIVAIGEGVALFSDYESNVYLRDYAAANSTTILAEISGLIVVAVFLSFIVTRASRAAATSRLGRFGHRIASLLPILSGLFAMVLWFVVVSKIVGGSLIYFEAYTVSVLFLISAWLMLGDRITVRMAVRNFTRRKTSMAIVIIGLMIGTAMISGALVTGDTLTELFTRGAYYGYGYADEVVYVHDPISFAYQYIGLNVSQTLASNLRSNPTAGSQVLGVTPEILDTVVVNDTSYGYIQTGVTLIGTFPNSTQTLGEFHRADKSIISSDLGNTNAILNDRAAKDLNASTGDTILVFYLSKIVSLQVAGIAVSDARGFFSAGDNLFVSMTAAQLLTNHPGQSNYIAITNIGGLRSSIDHTQAVGLAANQTLNQFFNQSQNGLGCKTDPSSAAHSAIIPCAYGEKKKAVDSATAGAQNLENFFVVLSTFAIIAGIVLIVNIFVMLAEERKSEMGMARAVGMRRGQLTKLFVFEGSLYAAGAAFVGVFVGIAIAYGILYAFGTIISGVFPVNIGQVLNSFTFTPQSLFTAFTEGFLITYVTILFTSWRVSKLNIIRAIRQIPEPPTGLKVYNSLLVFGIILAVAGVFLFQSAFASKSAVETLVGPSLVIFGIGLVMSRFVRNRYAFTFTGVALLVQWAVPSFSWNNPIIQNYSYGPELYFAGGILMVLGGVLVVMYNTDVAIAALRLFYRGRKTLTPVFRMALAYPENKRFRTAATVAMFALVIFTVSAIGSIAAEQNAALDKLVKQDSGGYDIITSTRVPVSNLTAQIMHDPHLNGLTVIPFNSTFLISIHDVTINQDFGKPPELIGADPNSSATSNFFLTNTFNMVNMTSNYKTAADVWNAVRTNSSKVIWSFGRVNTRGPPQSSVTPVPGDFLELKGFGVPAKTVQVVGILDGIFYEGLISRSQLLWDSFHVGTGTLSFVKVGPGQDPVTVSNILRRDFVKLQMATIVIPVLLANILQISQSILGLFEGFLGLGLVVGIAGLGILSVRSVVERRQEIGVLRALGFRRRMVIAAFIIENSYVALLGIMIGVLLGVNLGYAFAVSPNSGLTFVLPWQSILEIVGLTYGLSLLTTFNSSRRAGRIPPAEALRYSE